MSVTSSPKICTEYWPKPIPLRQFDWIAVTDDYDWAPDARPMPVGYGRTEAEAIADLQAQIDEVEQEPERCRDCGALCSDGISIDDRASCQPPARPARHQETTPMAKPEFPLYFPSLLDAARYYDWSDTPEAHAWREIEDGRAIIGPPECLPGQSLRLVDGYTRWEVSEADAESRREVEEKS